MTSPSFPHPLRLRRVYDPSAPEEGVRILVDRLWPRGVKKKEASGIDLWLRELAPSDALRRAFGHDPSRFAAFRQSYRAELDAARDSPALHELLHCLERGPVTLLYAARDPEHNNAAVLAEWLAKNFAALTAREAEEKARTTRPPSRTSRGRSRSL
jgi:uncharacterized protein YeaO (DUF488 family)